MTQLEKLYNAIESLKELGVALPQELIENTNMVEEEIIQNEVIPALSEAIEPIISQIQRELILVVEYVPDEPLQVRMTRKRSFKIPEPMDATPVSTNAVNNERKFTIAPHSKSKKTNLRSEEHTSELQSRENLVCRLLLEKKKKINYKNHK